ncbi:hypothetical protein BD779DRAFT_1520651 [Infundibulicybe gibba]|nr:hypothetical protein BD779DRAFT_1520651 [Infundibulicybe gibba]
MSPNMAMRDLPPLLSLPIEILDQILHPLPHMWAHLARRSDLARNVREVHLCERENRAAPDRFPSTLVAKSVDEKPENVEEGVRIKNLCQALKHMRQLRVFTWCWLAPEPTQNPAHEDAIFEVLSQSSSLTHLCLNGTFGRHAPDIINDPESNKYPVWRISKLKALCLLGDAWLLPANSDHVYQMLKRSSELESLELPMEFSRLGECKFPRLKQLRLPLQSGARPTIDDTLARFLERHPSIEDLYWIPIGHFRYPRAPFPTSSGSVPTEASSTTAESLLSLKGFDHKSLRKLKIHSFGDVSYVQQIGETYPNIDWLYLPNYHLPADQTHPIGIHIDNLLDILSCFPNLEVLIDNNKDRMHEAIMDVVQICPKLRQLDHCVFHDKRGDWMKIVIHRDQGPDGEYVNYEIRKPPPVDPFDSMYSMFD